MISRVVKRLNGEVITTLYGKAGGVDFYAYVVRDRET